jgi:hypothetical protein
VFVGKKRIVAAPLLAVYGTVGANYGGLGDTDVLDVKVAFGKEAQALGVLAAFADGDAFVFGVYGDDCDFFAVGEFGYADFSDHGRFEGVLDELDGVFAVFDDFLFLAGHAFKSVYVSSALTYGDADLAGVHHEYGSSFSFVNDTIFYTGATYLFE